MSKQTHKRFSTVLGINTSTVERFWAFVESTNKGECWNWLGGLGKYGYGTFYISREKRREGWKAPRFSYVLHFGSFDPLLDVCHKCDNPSCVNPDHLFLGTQKDNNDDCIAKGRKPIGELASFSKLKNKDIQKIKGLLAKGATQNSLAKRFRISQSSVAAINAGKTWRHNGGAGPSYTPGQPTGSHHGMAKLTEEKVLAIRRFSEEGALGKTLALQFGVTKQMISRILHRKEWKHI